MGYTAKFRVWRGDAGSGELKDYEVEVNEGEVVLDVLHRLQATQASDLAIRWNCKAGKCGSCSMEINGRPRLGCMTRMSIFDPAETLTITPMRTFPVIRDLVVEIGDFMRKLARVKPWLVRREEKPLSEGEHRQTPAEVDEYKPYSMCINCLLCYAACPVYGLDPQFIGPAAIALAQRYNLDSRDQGAGERLEALSTHEGVWGCTFVGECTKVCPKGVDPAGAIQRYKVKAALEWLKAFFVPRGAR